MQTSNMPSEYCAHVQYLSKHINTKCIICIRSPWLLKPYLGRCLCAEFCDPHEIVCFTCIMRMLHRVIWFRSCHFDKHEQAILTCMLRDKTVWHQCEYACLLKLLVCLALALKTAGRNWYSIYTSGCLTRLDSHVHMRVYVCAYMCTRISLRLHAKNTSIVPHVVSFMCRSVLKVIESEVRKRNTCMRMPVSICIEMHVRKRISMYVQALLITYAMALITRTWTSVSPLHMPDFTRTCRECF